MPKPSQSEQFDRIVTALLASSGGPAPNSGSALAGAAAIAAELRALPREEFKAKLKSQLQGRTKMASTAPAVNQEQAPRQSVTAHLIVKGGAQALDFYKRAFGAVETMRLNAPGGRIGHAEMRIGNASFFIADESPEYGAFGPQTLGGSPVTLHISVDDADAAFARAVERPRAPSGPGSVLR